MGLVCATEWERVPPGALRYPPIDHVVVPGEWAAGAKVVAAWEGIWEDGVKLSDHSGVVVAIDSPMPGRRA